MYFYFYAEYPAIIKLNGIYYGSITSTIKSCNFDNVESPFIEVCPLSSKQSSVNFILDSSFLSSPPEFISVTDLKGGYLIKFNKTFNSGDFGIIGQEKQSDFIATVFSDNGYKLSIETPNDFFAEALDFGVSCVTFNTGICGTEKLLSIGFNNDPVILEVYKLNGKIRKVYSGSVDSFSLTNELTTTEKFKDMAKHVRNCTWTYQNNVLEEKSRSVVASPNFSLENLPIKLLPYAFLEELLAGGDIAEYLSEGIKENASNLSGYLGEFLGIMPPPLFRRPEEIGLIYPIGERRYLVEYYTFEIENKKIANIKKPDL